MKKKIILKYILLYSPFMIGVGLYSFGVYNIFSSLLLFLGGYISIKNTLDYRKLNKNIDSVKIDNDIKKDYTKPRNPEEIIGFKRTRRYTKVRKRIKY